MSPSNEASQNDDASNKTTYPRQVEVLALREVAQRMTAAQSLDTSEDDMLQVVRLNWRLWTIFQVSMLDADCPLPAELRNNILSLSNFVDKHSAEIIAAPAASKLAVLIRLNHDLADGLSGADAANPQP